LWKDLAFTALFLSRRASVFDIVRDSSSSESGDSDPFSVIADEARPDEAVLEPDPGRALEREKDDLDEEEGAAVDDPNDFPPVRVLESTVLGARLGVFGDIDEGCTDSRTTIGDLGVFLQGRVLSWPKMTMKVSTVGWSILLKMSGLVKKKSLHARNFSSLSESSYNVEKSGDASGGASSRHSEVSGVGSREWVASGGICCFERGRDASGHGISGGGSDRGSVRYRKQIKCAVSAAI